MAHEKISFQLNENGEGKFLAKENDEVIGLMEVGVKGNTITAFHTEVLPAGEGKGWGKQLFQSLVEYARKKNFQIKPLCPFVLSQLKRGREEYNDVWAGE